MHVSRTIVSRHARWRLCAHAEPGLQRCRAHAGILQYIAQAARVRQQRMTLTAQKKKLKFFAPPYFRGYALLHLSFGTGSLSAGCDDCSTEDAPRCGQPPCIRPYPPAMDAHVSKQYNELDLYLRQSHAERDLEFLARTIRGQLVCGTGRPCGHRPQSLSGSSDLDSMLRFTALRKNLKSAGTVSVSELSMCLYFHGIEYP